MINEQNIVHVSARRQSAAGRFGAQDVLQEIEQRADSTNGWWKRLSQFFTGSTLMVGARAVKGFVVPHWAAGVLLAAIIGCFGFFYKSFSSEQREVRDMLIEMKTELRLERDHNAERMKDLQTQSKLNKVYLDNLSNVIFTMRGMLTPEQQQQLEKIKPMENQ